MGAPLRSENLIEKLRRLGYYETSGELRTKGEYRVLRSSGTIEIFLHDFAYPTEQSKGVPVRLSLQSNSVARIENLATGQEMFSLELEPELVTGLYERIWQERRLVKLADVPPLLVKAILAVEDERFYRHHGVDPIGILRAMWVNLRTLSYQQGGSTLTQQLVKNFFLSDERTMSRKIPEAFMALIAERKYSKDTILENYLNEIYLGQKGSQGIFGVWEAAQFYFAKPLSDLTTGECALLAGLIRAPNRLSPYRSYEAATRRRNVVLAKLLDDQIISRNQYDAALREKLPQRALVKVTNDAPFYVDYLRRELEENYSNAVLTKEGLRIFSSLDLQLQKIAERSLAEGLNKLEAAHPALRRKGEDSLEGAIVVLRPQTGEIKAMVGGRNYSKSQFNRVFQAKRQPGSVFKPFVYLAALMYGGQSGIKYTPDTIINDSQFTWSYDGQRMAAEQLSQRVFRRRDFSPRFGKFAQFGDRSGGAGCGDSARARHGASSRHPKLFAGGAVACSRRRGGDAARSGGRLFDSGQRWRTAPPVGGSEQVMDQNTKVLEKRDVRSEQVISPQLAFMMNDLLKGVLDRGTGAMARRLGFTRPAAGKTGTTNDYKDAWFVGYTPDLLAVVWVGFDGPSKLNLSGAEAALPIWTDFMKSATASMPVTDFVAPAPTPGSEEAPNSCPPGEEGTIVPCPPAAVPARASSEPL